MEVSEQSPLYSQIGVILIDYIKNDAQVHQKMLSEREICRKYNVSRTTVRSALKELEDLGYIYKRHGKGTFVSGLWKERQNLSEGYSFTEQMKELGRTPQTILTTFDYKKANPFVAEQLGLEEQETVIRLRRIRLADDEPMMIETTFLPSQLFPDLSAELVRSKPLYDIFANDYQQVITYADEEFSAGILEEHEAKILKVNPRSACLRLKRTTINRENRIIEFTISVARSDQFFYKVRHYRTTQTSDNSLDKSHEKGDV